MVREVRWFIVKQDTWFRLLLVFVFFNISQGSVATHQRWGGIFINNFIVNFQLSTSVKELWKSVNILQRYEQEYSVSRFWLTVYISQTVQASAKASLLS